MSYQVLARKWRPHTFQTMVGQEPVLRMLMNALDHQRLHHAYLFTGTRGVGKTSIARIFAKCLNCETSISSKACDQCNTCLAIDAGRFIDLIEVDAASRTKVEDTRELLENINYAPTQGRFKIYLIDEVHMLSGHSFNALLKTLEEPPEHVKFLFATTDPKRLPITILSRCLQFNLKRVPEEQIANHLAFICTAENIAFDDGALPLIATAADGSLRDALSLLDQTIAFCQQKITLTETKKMLGHVEHDLLLQLLRALSEKNGNNLFAAIQQLNEQAPDYQQVLAELLSVLHQIAICQMIPDLKNQPQILTQLAKKFSPEETQLYYQIGLIGKRDLPYTPHPVQGFEMIMLRMLAFKPATETYTTTTPAVAATTPAPIKEIKKIPETIPTTTDLNWFELLPRLQLTGMAQVLAANCSMIDLQKDSITLALSAEHETLLNERLTDRIAQALHAHLGRTIKLQIKIAPQDIHTPAKAQQKEATTKQAKATHAINTDTQIQKIVDVFNATIDTHSIKTKEPQHE